MAWLKGVVVRLLAVIVAAAVIVYFLLPIYWLVIASFKSPGLCEYTSLGEQTICTNELFAGNPLWLNRINPIQYVNVLSGTMILRWIANSFLISGSSTIIGVLVSTMAGYALAQYTFRGRSVLVLLVAAMFMVPVTALAVPQFLFLLGIGWLGTYQSVIVPCSASVFGVFFMSIYIPGAVSPSVIEAARLDGAGELKIFFTIVFRLLGSGLITLCLIIFIGAWNNFLLPSFVLTDMNKYLVTQGVAAYMGGGVQNRALMYSYFISGSVLSIVPLIAVFVCLERFVEKGLYLGAWR
jgi:multiple sugar transport system permease protein